MVLPLRELTDVALVLSILVVIVLAVRVLIPMVLARMVLVVRLLTTMVDPWIPLVEILLDHMGALLVLVI